jgi:hypothetical protein
LENSLDEIYRSQQDQWIEEFQKNEIFKILNKTQQENSEFVLSTFMEYMFNYEGVMPGQWTTSNVEEVCLRIVPRKIVADEETFEVYGDVLACFFNFIGEQKYINNAQRLINKVQKIKTKILDNSKDPRFYGMTKSLMFGRGGSLSNDSEVLNMDNVIKNLESLSPNEKVPKTKKIAQRPLTPNPFKGIGRNEKITVKYTDGRIIEDVKFKKVEMDLKNGKCEMEK